MNSQGDDQAGFYQNDQASQKAPKAKSRLMSMTMKQFLESNQPNPEEEAFVINNHTVTQGAFLGQVLSVENSSTSLIFQIDDGTATARVRIWVEHDVTSYAKNRSVEWGPGVYVSFFGDLKAYSGMRTIVTTKLTKLTDFNEISYHFLDVIHTHLLLTRGAPIANGDVAAANSKAVDQGNVYAANPYQQPVPVVDDSNDDPLRKAICDYISEHGDSDGLPKVVIINALGQVGHDKAAVTEKIEVLYRDGVLFPTVNDDTVSLTGDDI
eukprot:TRINITY_DN5286_c0_g1_i1.p1 TRINITY_DN5286_c0_g1~~TRINITY_DN5286_c0_g1_i1.p1  ORF type:complete len:267 (+),score=58.78 TRINITY_DN5286_c0_g1_i1:142-942(+)